MFRQGPCYNEVVAITRKSILMPLVLFVGWSLWFLASLATAALKGPGAIDWALRVTTIFCALSFLACGLMFLIYDRIKPRPSLGGYALLVPLLCYVAGSWCDLLVGLVRWWLGWNPQFSPSIKFMLLGGGVQNGVSFLLFSMLYFAVDHWLQLSEQREQARAATVLAQQAQLQMLRYQINPHFLFNALNSIRAMILENPVQARAITTELSEFLRYSLDGCGSEATIASEIAAIENYLAIQRIRFEKKLAITLQVDPAARDCTVPCFLVHPLVENAVKYGMDTSPMPLRLEILVVRQDDDLIIRVSNTGRLVDQPQSQGTGTGLRNVRQRLALTFPDRHTFTLVEGKGWVHAEIQVRAPGFESTVP